MKMALWLVFGWLERRGEVGYRVWLWLRLWLWFGVCGIWVRAGTSEVKSAVKVARFHL